MNINNLKEIINSYIAKFDLINGTEHREVYKWETAYVFKGLMDTALQSDTADFAGNLMKVKNCTANLMDSYTQPFYGLCKLAQHEPETVRQLFMQLYAEDNGDLRERQTKISAFIKESNKLAEKYYPGTYLYRNDYHSGTAYLFFYDPDNQYMFKQSHAKQFADVIGFPESWGSGTNPDLTVYYRMCDQVLDLLKQSPELMETDRSRFTDQIKSRRGECHRDTNKHILLFDIIYCTSVYGLFKGLTFKKRSEKDQKEFQLKRNQAKFYKEELDKTIVLEDELLAARDCFSEMMPAGATVIHSVYGEVTVVENDGHHIVLQTPEKVVRLNLVTAVANEIIIQETEQFTQVRNKYLEVLRKEADILNGRKLAEKNYKAFSAYLDE